MKPIEYDKPRIVSTVIIFLFLGLSIFFTAIVYPLTWSAIKAAVDEAGSSNSDSAAGAVTAASAVAFLGAFAIVFVFIVDIGVIITNLILLPFAIKNRKSTLKPVRIISYVQDGLIGLTLIAAILKIVLLIVGV